MTTSKKNPQDLYKIQAITPSYFPGDRKNTHAFWVNVKLNKIGTEKVFNVRVDAYQSMNIGGPDGAEYGIYVQKAVVDLPAEEREVTNTKICEWLEPQIQEWIKRTRALREKEAQEWERVYNLFEPVFRKLGEPIGFSHYVGSWRTTKDFRHFALRELARGFHAMKINFYKKHNVSMPLFPDTFHTQYYEATLSYDHEKNKVLINGSEDLQLFVEVLNDGCTQFGFSNKTRDYPQGLLL